MKIWKKVLVLAVAFLTVGAIVATQQIQVKTEANLGIETREATFQIAASDPAIAPSSGSESYLLENYSGAAGKSTEYMLSLGDWGAHNNFTSAGAFIIANTENKTISIDDCWVVNDTWGYVNDYPVDVYLHSDASNLIPADSTADEVVDVQYYDAGNGPVTPGSGVHLANTTEGYASGTGNLNLKYTTNNFNEASWTDQGDGRYIWQYDGTQAATGLTTDPTSTANYCYVYISIAPTDATDLGQYNNYRMGFNITTA